MSEETTNETTRELFNRRKFIQFATLTAGGALLAACDSQTKQAVKITTEPTVAPAAVTATAEASVGKTFFPSPAPNVPDAYTVAFPPFQSVSGVPGQGGSVSVFSVTYNTPATPKSMNRFWQEMEQRLNVTWNVTLATGNESYSEKVGTLLASGNLPDLFMLLPGASPTLLQALRQGAFNDLTPYLSGSALNDYPNIANFPPAIWKSVARNGKIYGVPRCAGYTGGVLLYRKDWMKKLGISDPKNGNDFYNMMQAFTKGDPDGNGTADTWGMGFTSSGMAGHPFFMNMFRVPNQWRLESNGTMTYYIETDEYRQAVDYMSRMYAAGLFYPGSLTQTGVQSKQNFLAGKYGTFLGVITDLYDLRQKIKSLNSSADIGILVPFGADGGQGNHWMSFGYNGFTGIPSSISDMNRIKELLRILNYLSAPIFSVENDFLNYGINGWDNKKDAKGVKVRTSTGNNEIGDLFNVGNGPLAYYYPEEPSLAPVVQEYTRRLLQIGVSNPVPHQVSQTSATRLGPLGLMVNDRVLRIIKGNDPLSALDSLIRDWQNQGGSQIAQEYAQALQAQH